MESNNLISSFINKLLVKGLEGVGRYYSCYRGFVVSNDDPNGQGRLLVKCPAIVGLKNIPAWSYPKGVMRNGNSGDNLIPPVDSMVWVEFEYGDTNHPVWSYGYNAAHSQNTNFVPGAFTRQTPNGSIINMDDINKNITIKTPNGYSIILDDKNQNILISSIKGLTLKFDDTHNAISFNGGSKGGLIDITVLLNNVNSLITNYNALARNFNTHSHPAVGSGPPQDATASQSASLEKATLEDIKVTH